MQSGQSVNMEGILESRREIEERAEQLRVIQVDAERRQAFLSERGEMLRALNPEIYRSFIEAENQAGKKEGHEYTNVGKGITDQFRCSCGTWEGPGHWDGAEFERDYWLWHILEAGVTITYPKVSAQAA